MLRSIEEILGYKLQASDGHLGRVKDVHFDDTSWAVRYILVDSGGWLVGRQIVLAPQVLGEPDPNSRQMSVALGRQRIEDSPVIMRERGLTLGEQRLLAEYYDWSLPPAQRREAAAPPSVADSGGRPARTLLQSQQAEQLDAHLKSLREMIGYHVRARGVDVGHIEDVLVQTDGWLLRYLVVDTRNLVPGKKVLVSPAWVPRVEWSGGVVDVDLPAGALKDGPAYDASQIVSPEYEKKLFDHYGGDRCWE
jgi:sporulation protein YlmC with PRC-barrel domain